jgi:hypothetical protein
VCSILTAQISLGSAQESQEDATNKPNDTSSKTSLLRDFATAAGLPAEKASRVYEMVEEIDDSSFIETLGMTKVDALQSIFSIAAVGGNLATVHSANKAIDDLSKITKFGEDLGEACSNHGAEWAACEVSGDYARMYSKDPEEIKKLIASGKKIGATDPIDWCHVKCDPLFEKVNDSFKLLKIQHISDDACREIRSLVEGCGDAHARENPGFNPITDRIANELKELEEAHKAAGFPKSPSYVPQSSNSTDADLKNTVTDVQDTARSSVFRVFLAGQATVAVIQFNQLLNTRTVLNNARISVDGSESLVEEIRKGFFELKGKFENLNILNLNDNLDPRDEIQVVRTISFLQGRIQAFDNVLGRKIAELEILRKHVLEPKGKSCVHSAVFNIASAAATYYTTASMSVTGINKILGKTVSCVQAGMGVGNAVTAYQAYKQIKIVNENLTTLKSIHEMFDLIFEQLRAENEAAVNRGN